MNLKYSQLAHLTQFSNEKMVDLIKTKLAESENAAGALVFDDKIIVLDEESEDLYSVKYDIQDRALNLHEWEKINVIPDNKSYLEELAEDYFDPTGDPNIRTKDLVEAFKLKYSDEPFRRLINQASVEKKSIVESDSRIKSLKKLREARGQFIDDIADVVNDEKIKTIANNVNENSPVQNTVSRIDFKHPLSVSLFEEKSDRVISLSEGKKKKQRASTVRKKVKNLWTSESFKNDVKSMMDELSEAEDTKKVIENFVNNHKEVLVLSEEELEDLFLKTTLMIGEAANSEQVTQLMKDYYNLEEVQEERDDYLERNMISEAEGEGDAGGGYEFGDEDFEEEPEGEEPAAETGGEDQEKDKSKKKSSKKKESTIDEDSINKIIKVLNKIKETQEEKTMERKYIENFIQALEDAKVGTMSEGKLKEIMDFLSSIYQEAQESGEEE
jgi:hypothetical protein